MKKIAITFLFISSQMIAQIKYSGTFSRSVPVKNPTHSQMMVDFAKNNWNKKVGGGVCYELVGEALKQFGMKKSDIGWSIPFDSIQAGDIITLKDRVDKEGNEMVGHIGIIVMVSDTLILVAHQNWGKTVKDSKVGIQDLKYLISTEGKSYVSQTAYFYHVD